MKYLIICLILLISASWVDARVIERELIWTELAVKEAGNGIAYDFSGSVKSGALKIPAFSEMILLERALSSASIVHPQYLEIEVPQNIAAFGFGEEPKLNYEVLQSAGNSYVQVSLVPFVVRDGHLYRLVRFGIDLQEGGSMLKAAEKSAVVWSSSSVLASGKWVKIKTSGAGVFKIKYSDLKSWGFASPSSVSVFGNGGYMLPKMNSQTFTDDLAQNAVWLGKDGSNNDCLFFYSPGTVAWTYSSTQDMFIPQQNQYSDVCYYYLTDGVSSRQVSENAWPSGSPARQVTDYDYYDRHEKDETNLIESGAEWYGDRHSKGQSRTVSFTVPSRVVSEKLKMRIATVGRSAGTSTMSVLLNDKEAGIMTYKALDVTDPEADYAYEAYFRKDTVYAGTDVSIKTTYETVASSGDAWINYIVINCRNSLQFTGVQMMFRDMRVAAITGATEYAMGNASSGIKIWDVTDPLNVFSVKTETSGSQMIFRSESSVLHEFVAFNPSGEIPQPEKVGEVENQNLHALAVPEMLIVCHSRFLAQAKELAEFHNENDQMDVAVCTTEQIANEFSSGTSDAAGIRNFIRMLYDRSGTGGTIKYVLLLGDGSFDHKNILGGGYDLVPTYQSDESLTPTESFVSDDFFVLLDSTEGGYQGLIDLGIGRIPARTTDEAEAVVEKIKNYVSTDALGRWRSIVALIGDDQDNNAHMWQSDQIADMISQSYPSFYTDKIYCDAYRQESTAGVQTYPDVNDAINTRVKNGVLIMNYIGHANEQFLADEKILEINDIDAWSNGNNLPIFVTASCEFSRFDADDMSAGEHILFNSTGGGIGLFSTTRVVYSGENFNLTQSFYRNVFEKDESGQNLRMGDIMRLAKVGSNTGINKRSFTLLADPALRLAYPHYRVKTETVNGQEIANFSDPVSAQQKVTITGSVVDFQGQLLSDFNGKIIPVVYDKAVEVETLANDGGSKMSFMVQNNIIYKGNAGVENGKFTFSFIVPKDISYSVGKGKIMYYADNGETDASGAFANFLIGGASGTNLNDTQGPDIKLYLNDPSFENGSKVGASPLLIAELFDENGINTVGTGIGHDITAVIDGDNSSAFLLNDYYQADKDSYQSGKVTFPLNDLDPGKHSVTLKVWDVVNNSSEATISFVITSDFHIKDLYCYPNPFHDYTNIVFTHDYPDAVFSAVIEVFDRSGKIVSRVEKEISSNETESVPYRWSPSSLGVMMPSGLYFYRLTLEAPNGATAAKAGKFVFGK